MADTQTTTDWRMLPAGRELDALVAERVMGWTGVKLGWAYYEHPGIQMLMNCPHGVPPKRAHQRELPRFSTDIAAAWPVVERMAAEGLTLTLQWKGADREYANTAEAIFTRSIWTAGHAVADTPALAICRAALAAKATPTFGSPQAGG